MAAHVPSKIDSLQRNSLQKMKENKHKSIWQAGSRMNVTNPIGLTSPQHAACNFTMQGAAESVAKSFRPHYHTETTAAYYHKPSIGLNTAFN